MSLVHYEVAYHLTDNPNKTHVIRLLMLTGEDPASVDDYLRRKYGPGKVVLHYVEREREREQVDRERTCGYCGCTRIEYESGPRPLHPATPDKSLWRTL